MHKGYCTVCKHEKFEEINKMLLNNATLASISKTYGISYRTIKKHQDKCFSRVLESNKKAKDSFVSNILLKNVEEKLALLDKIIYGCSDYLTDPADSEKFFMGARSTEVDIVYQEKNERSGKLGAFQKKATLQSLLNTVESTDRFVISNVQIKHSDPRDLLIKGVSELKQVVKMLIDTTQVVVENEYKSKALDKATKEGGSISFEKEIATITERVTIALKESNTEELSILAELPEL